MSDPQRLLRCAIYTRKSTEHNLDLAFNSLDAQREACEAYIKSQAHEGWRLIPGHYDDGGLSGASLERPALQLLLKEVEAGKIDVVVVYKVDRLTRSLTDFAKLVELFDRRAVSFVSVTQSFNTTSSMGRLTLNVLLSFAQFEREVIGERVRDKIAASKRKGLWVGGPVPLGYASINKKLVVIPEEADSVRTIFRSYVELGSIGALAEELDRLGIRSKRRVLASGRTVGGGRFGMGALAHLLSNRFYLGEVVYRGETHASEHEPILDRALFDAVQAKRAANAVERKAKLRGSPALLMGRIFDEEGNRMTPSHSNKNGVRYRYYLSQALVQRKTRSENGTYRVSAPDVEGAVLAALKDHLAKAGLLSSGETGDSDLMAAYIDRVVVRARAIDIILQPSSSSDNDRRHEGGIADADAHDVPAIVLTVPRAVRPFRAAKGIVGGPPQDAGADPGSREALLTAIAKARSWLEDLVTGRSSSFRDIAKREGKIERHIRRLMLLAFVSPDAVKAIAEEPLSSSPPTITALAQSVSDSWRAPPPRTI